MTECTDPKIRGVIGSFPSISMSSGVLTAYIFGTFFTWDNLAWTCCGVASNWLQDEFVFIINFDFFQSL